MPDPFARREVERDGTAAPTSRASIVGYGDGHSFGRTGSATAGAWAEQASTRAVAARQRARATTASITGASVSCRASGSSTSSAAVAAGRTERREGHQRDGGTRGEEQQAAGDRRRHARRDGRAARGPCSPPPRRSTAASSRCQATSWRASVSVVSTSSPRWARASTYDSSIRAARRATGTATSSVDDHRQRDDERCGRGERGRRRAGHRPRRAGRRPQRHPDPDPFVDERVDVVDQRGEQVAATAARPRRAGPGRAARGRRTPSARRSARRPRACSWERRRSA